MMHLYIFPFSTFHPYNLRRRLGSSLYNKMHRVFYITLYCKAFIITGLKNLTLSEVVKI